MMILLALHLAVWLAPTAGWVLSELRAELSRCEPALNNSLQLRAAVRHSLRSQYLRLLYDADAAALALTPAPSSAPLNATLKRLAASLPPGAQLTLLDFAAERAFRYAAHASPVEQRWFDWRQWANQATQSPLTLLDKCSNIVIFYPHPTKSSDRSAFTFHKHFS